MSEFENMQQIFLNWADQSRGYRLRANEFARRFAFGFAKHIGAPDHYLSADRKTKDPYAEPLMLVARDDGREEGRVPEDPFDFIRTEEDGWHFFGIRYVLDRATNRFPKHPFCFAARFQLRENSCTIQVAGCEFNVDPNDSRTFGGAYDQMIAKLKESLSRKPWEVSPKEAIGFMQPKPN